MTTRFEHLFDKSPLPPKIQEQVDRIKAGEYEIDHDADPSDEEDDDGPPFFGATPWQTKFFDGTPAYFTVLYSREMDLAAVARSMAAGCMVRQLGIGRGGFDEAGNLPPLMSVVASPDARWRIQSDLGRVIGEVPAYLKPCQPGVAGKQNGVAGKRKGIGRKQNGKRPTVGNSEAGGRRFAAKPRTRPAAGTKQSVEDYVRLFHDRNFVEDIMRAAVPPPGVDRFDYGTLEERPTGHLAPAPLHRDGDRVWQLRLRSGQRAFVLLFDETIPDAFMGLRVLTNTALTWVDAIERGELGPDDLLPPVAPIVVYRGPIPWTAPTNIRDVISQRNTGLEGTHEQEYLVVDMNAAS